MPNLSVPTLSYSIKSIFLWSDKQCKETNRVYLQSWTYVVSKNKQKIATYCNIS